MRADDPELRSRAAKDEAEILAAIISAASIDQRSTDTLKLAMRHRMLRELSKITQDLEKKAQQEEEKTLRWPALEGGKEVWIYFFMADRGLIGSGATLMKKENGPLVAAQMMQKNPIWHMRRPSFLKAIEELKQDILNGNYDEQLGTDPSTLIYDAFK